MVPVMNPPVEVEVLTGPPGCGKSTKLREEVRDKKGLYLFFLPTIPLIREQVAAFEREAPGEDQAHSVVWLLQQAHDRRPLTEDYLDTSSWSDLPTLNRDALQKIPVRRAICP